ncbi:MAG: hypothetical protein CVU29_01775 [Betaproteobacteria bacterium HGW-Betaproteobacteria-22]|nr:MAG: hypothetical protein CVU29_01775 [Betaproteobacteria bacterium HGW-Betaproteobacteria-22]
MAQQPSETMVQQMNFELVPGPLSQHLKVDHYEQLRLIENNFANAVADHFETQIADVKEGAKLILKLMQGDEAVQKQLAETAGNTLSALTDPNTVIALKDALKASIDEMRIAYEQGDVGKLGTMAGAAFAGSIDPKKKLDMASDLSKLGKMHPNSRHHESTKPWEGDTNPSQPHDPAFMHGRRPIGDLEIDGVLYKEDGTRELVNRPPLELLPIDKPEAASLNKKPVNVESTHRGNAPEDDHFVRNTLVATTAVAGAVAAGVAGKSYLEQQDRDDRVHLSNAYKAAVGEVLGETDADRQLRYTQALKKHPELDQAIKGYESVRLNLVRDGALSEQDQNVLAMVAYNTNLTILDGRLAQIKVTAPEFLNPGHDREFYLHQESAPQR